MQRGWCWLVKNAWGGGHAAVTKSFLTKTSDPEVSIGRMKVAVFVSRKISEPNQAGNGECLLKLKLRNQVKLFSCDVADGREKNLKRTKSPLWAFQLHLKAKTEALKWDSGSCPENRPVAHNWDPLCPSAECVFRAKNINKNLKKYYWKIHLDLRCCSIGL